jgi:hypothetical protein
MKILILLLSFMFATNVPEATALTFSQQKVKDAAKYVGENNCVKDMCFTKTLQAIAWQESSYGTHIVGDAKGTYYFYKHNDKEVTVKRKDTFMKGGTRYYWYKPANNKYIKKVYSKTGWKPLELSSLGPFQVQIPTAKRVINKMNLTKYRYLLSDEQALVNLLLKSPKFGALIAVNYLKLNYNYAKRINHRNPWFLTVSRYNGGDNNKRYVNKIIYKIKRL